LIVAKDKAYLYPGLNAPSVKGLEVLKPSQTDKDPEEEKKIISMRDQRNKVVDYKA